MTQQQSDPHPLGGIYSALITPFLQDGRLNVDALAPLAEFEISQGIHGFYVGGSTGEAFLQSPAERKVVLQAFAKCVRGRAKLIAHVGAIYTDEAISMARCAADAGYDAISAIPPFYYDFSVAEVQAHYEALAECSPLPLIVYNFPGKTARPFSTSDLINLLSHPKIIGIKHTSQNLYQLERLKSAAPQSVIYNGYDEMFVGAMAMGADGGIGTTFNVMGGLFVKMYEAMKAADLPLAKSLQTRANAVIDVLIEVGVFPGTKHMLKVLGVDCGACRKPYSTLSPAQERKVEDIVASHVIQLHEPTPHA